MVQIRVCVGILGPPVGFDPSGPSKWGCWVKSHGAKSHGTHNALFLRLGSSVFPRLEKYRVFDLFVIGNGGPLMLACSNVHVSEEFSIFGNTFCTNFRVSHGFVTPIKGCMVTDFYISGWF